MSVSADLKALVDYSDHERRKWKEWVAADPRRLQIAFQTGERFPTIGVILDHIFLVERRHLARLEGSTPPDTTGVRPGDWQALFEYAELVQADLRKYVDDMDEAGAQETLTFTVSGGTFTMTRQKLLVHILLHEIRHLAQVALAGRTAGQNPPGQHDYFYCPEAARL